MADLGPSWGRVGAELGPSCGRVGAELGSSWGQVGGELGPSWGRVGAELGPSWGRVGAKFSTLSQVVLPHNNIATQTVDLGMMRRVFSHYASVTGQ